MNPNRLAALMFLFGSFYAAGSRAEDPETGIAWSFGGHVKYQGIYEAYSGDSAFHDLFGSENVAQSLFTRLHAAADRGRWGFSLDYQLVAIRSDSLEESEATSFLPAPGGGVVSDNRRWWDLTGSITHGNRSTLISRLDRLHLTYTSANTVWRFGRQAISWGNGLVFTPMDVFNPFDPAAVDKEYKPGDDMLYAQRLLSNGSDLQGLILVRRDPVTGQVESDESSLAVKYHGFIGTDEFDLLLAEHYGDLLLGFGGIFSLGGAIWRGDIVWTDTGRDSVSAVSSINYSWTWGGRNVSGLVEYYFTQFGQRHQNYAIDTLRENANLWQRLERGELFTLGRHYLATSLTVEMSPLFRLTPNFFVNLQDPSALAQIVAQYDWKQDLALLAAINIPFGPEGSEYGGPALTTNGKYLSHDGSLFIQLAFYF